MIDMISKQMIFIYQQNEQKWKQLVADLTLIKPQEEVHETQIRLDICKNPGTRDVKGTFQNTNPKHG